MGGAAPCVGVVRRRGRLDRHDRAPFRNRDHELGKYCTAECQAAYDRLIAERMANGRHTATPGSDLTIAELMLA